jgi:hypothetical protein
MILDSASIAYVGEKCGHGVSQMRIARKLTMKVTREYRIIKVRRQNKIPSLAKLKTHQTFSSAQSLRVAERDHRLK